MKNNERSKKVFTIDNLVFWKSIALA